MDKDSPSAFMDDYKKKNQYLHLRWMKKQLNTEI